MSLQREVCRDNKMSMKLNSLISGSALGSMSQCDLSELNLNKVPEALFKFRNLKYIFLENNNITELSDTFFKTFVHLTWLDLRRNNLISIPNSIQDHAALETLLLDDNILVRLPKELGSVPNLKGLQVTNNPLEYPPEKVIKKGVQEIISYLKTEWTNKCEDETKADSEEKSPNIGSFLHGNPKLEIVLEKKGTRGCIKKCGTQKAFKRTKRSPSLELGKYFRIKKLLKSKPKTTLNLFEFWDQLTPTQLKERLSYTQLAKYEKPGDQSSSRMTSALQSFQRTDILKISYQIKCKVKKRRRFTGSFKEKLKTKEEFERAVHTNHVKSLRLVQRKMRLEKQERILQRMRSTEALKNWRYKVFEQQQRTFRSQIWKVFPNYDGNINEQADTIQEKSMKEDFYSRFSLIQKDLKELNDKCSVGGVDTLGADRILLDQKIDKLNEIQNRLKMLKLQL